MKYRNKFAFYTSLIVSILLGLSACGGDSGSSSSGGNQSNLSVYLTDAPTDEVTSVVVAITGLTIKPANNPVERKILDQVQRVDLLTLENSRLLLTSVSVPAGDYQFIRVDLDQSQSHIVASGEQQPLKIASEEVKVLGGFNVPVSGQLEILLDFDARASLVKQGNGNWLMKPVIVRK